MLGLPQQIRGTKLSVNGFIGDDHGFGRTSEEVDTDPTEKLPLRFGDKCVARAHKQVHRINTFSANRHRTDRLDATQHIDFMSATKMHRSNHGRVRLSVKGRCAGDDTWHACHRSGGNGHMRRGHHREFTPGHIAADGLNWDVLVTQNHTGQRFHFDIQH